MKKFNLIPVSLFGLVVANGCFAQQGPIPIVGLVELSGTGATAGTNFDNGVKLAVKEINAAGGILGRKIQYTSMDTQSAPQTAKALAQKAVDEKAYVVMGPVFSGSFIVSMAETKRAEIPNFTGGEAANITQQGNPYVFRTSFTQSTAMPKLARYIKDAVKAKTVAIVWVNNDFGKGGRDSMTKALEAQGIKVAADVSTDPGQVDFSAAVLKVKQSNADAAFVYTNEEESARALREPERAKGVDRAGRGPRDDELHQVNHGYSHSLIVEQYRAHGTGRFGGRPRASCLLDRRYRRQCRGIDLLAAFHLERDQLKRDAEDLRGLLGEQATFRVHGVGGASQRTTNHLLTQKL